MIPLNPTWHRKVGAAILLARVLGGRMSITGVGFAATWGARDGVVRMIPGCEQGTAT